MRQVTAVVLREMLIFRRRFWRYFLSFSISPFLYLVAFGWARDNGLDAAGNQSYSLFLIPGLVAMTSMINSFALAIEINVARFYWRTFDEIRSAPVSDAAYVTGEVLSGVFRGTFAAAIVIILGMVFGAPLFVSPALVGCIVLNTLVFSALAVSAAMLAKKHADQALINSFIITPMAFLCGTFFPVDIYPEWIQIAIKLLPLTHAASAIRASALGNPIPLLSVGYLVFFGLVAFCIAVRVVRLSRT